MEDVSELVSALREEVGDELRVVADYTEEGYELHYVREDVQESIENVDVEKIHHDLIIQGIGKDYLEDLFHAGELHCSVHRFDEITAFHFVNTERSGGFVSVDSDARIEFRSFVDTCKRHL